MKKKPSLLEILEALAKAGKMEEYAVEKMRQIERMTRLYAPSVHDSAPVQKPRK